ncbi:hypothetical protein HYZ82_00170 [Candidatus Nomurabacteria bacterium]|nr:hypothetical protein [Candidatus Nomurabacteria bacterium]
MNTIEADTATKLAGLQIDTLQKYRDRQITLDQWERFNNLSPEDREEQFGDWKRPKAEPVVYLRRLFDRTTFHVPATHGTKKFKGSGVFGDRVYGEEAVPEEKSSRATDAIVYEQIVNGSWAKVFGSLGAGRGRWQNREQVLIFCDDHPDALRTDGYATFFELEGGFVASVFFGGGGRLGVRVFPFSRGCVWHAWCRRRFVAPQ